MAAANAAHFPGNNQAAPSASTLSTPTRTNLELLLHVTTQMLQGADNTAQQAGQLADKAKQLGLNFEEQLAHALRRLPPDSDTAQIRHTFQHALQSAAEQGTTLKHALLLTQAAAAELDAAGLGSLQQDLSTVLKNVTGQQLMQTSGGDRADLLYQFAAVPVRHGKDEQTVELHVMARKSHGQKTIDPANCYVLFRLDMPNLGELDIHLHIVDKVVGVRFLSEKHADMAVTPADQRDLRDALQKVGFHLGVLKVEDKKQQEPGAAEPLLPPILTHKQFDLKI
ncbi:flagellar hook-length control protein FliK [Tumebacillus sp. BK434]|nr:flagellar hook-length control protein FliK [Tumebacillus sp. BK434]